VNAQPIHITVKAVPVDSLATQYMIECSDCGPVEVVADTQADERCLIHLEKHEVDTGPFRQEMK
jgi:hypothetical protein